MPPGGSARNKSAPQLGQVGRLAWPIARILPPVPTFVKPNQARRNLGLWKCSRFERNGPQRRGNAEARSEGVCPGYRHNSIIPRSAYRSRFELVGSKLNSPDQSGNGLHDRELRKRVAVSTRPGPPDTPSLPSLRGRRAPPEAGQRSGRAASVVGVGRFGPIAPHR